MVPNLVFDTQILSYLGPRIEEIVRHDIGSSTPVPYAFVDPEVPAPREGSPTDLRHRIGLGWTTIGTIRFGLPWPREATLTGQLVQFGLPTYLGSLRYALALDRRIDGEVKFERQKSNGGPTFVGGTAAARLNAVPGLAERVSRILRDQFFSGTMWVKGAGCGLTVIPAESGSTFELWTYGRLTNVFGRNGTTDAGEILTIAGLIEDAL